VVMVVVVVVVATGAICADSGHFLGLRVYAYSLQFMVGQLTQELYVDWANTRSKRLICRRKT
jgi:hypothetical protein